MVPQSFIALDAIEAPQLAGQRQSRNRNILKSWPGKEKNFFTRATTRGRPTVFALAATLFKPKYNRGSLLFALSSQHAIEYPSPNGPDRSAFIPSGNPDEGGKVPKIKPQISVVDDDESMREAVRGLMKSLGYTAQAFASADEFLNSRHFPRTSCLIADVQMPGMTGLELHRHLVASGKTIPTILITAYPDDSARERALGDGVVCYLGKPFDENDLLSCIRSSLRADAR